MEQTLKTKLFLARFGTKEHLDQLVRDPAWFVRREVVKFGHKEHLDQLVSDPNWPVRREVAKQLEKLKIC